MARTKAVIHVEDLTADQAYADRNPTTVAAVELGGVRTYLAVPPTRRVVVASSSSPIGEAEVERLTRELNEAR